MLTQGQCGHIVAREELLRRDEHVGEIAEVRLDEFLVVTGDEESTVDVFPSKVIHCPGEIFDTGVDFEECQKVSPTNMNAHPSDRG